MSQFTSLSIPENVRSALVQLQDEVEKVEKSLLELQQKKHEFLQHQLNAGVDNLARLANSINTLAYSIESEIIKFKESAFEVNQLYHAVQDSPGFKALGRDKAIMPRQRLLNIWEVNNLDISVPTVIRREYQFILTVKAVNIHQEIVPQQSVDQTTKISTCKFSID